MKLAKIDKIRDPVALPPMSGERIHAEAEAWLSVNSPSYP